MSELIVEKRHHQDKYGSGNYWHWVLIANTGHKIESHGGFATHEFCLSNFRSVAGSFLAESDKILEPTLKRVTSRFLSGNGFPPGMVRLNPGANYSFRDQYVAVAAKQVGHVRPYDSKARRIRRLNIGETPKVGDTYSDETPVLQEDDRDPVTFDDFHGGEAYLRLFPEGTRCPRCHCNDAVNRRQGCLCCNPADVKDKNG